MWLQTGQLADSADGHTRGGGGVGQGGHRRGTHTCPQTRHERVRDILEVLLEAVLLSWFRSLSSITNSSLSRGSSLPDVEPNLGVESLRGPQHRWSLQISLLLLQLLTPSSRDETLPRLQPQEPSLCWLHTSLVQEGKGANPNISPRIQGSVYPRVSPPWPVLYHYIQPCM